MELYFIHATMYTGKIIHRYLLYIMSKTMLNLYISSYLLTKIFARKIPKNENVSSVPVLHTVLYTYALLIR
jgi:hypothetical protein